MRYAIVGEDHPDTLAAGVYASITARAFKKALPA
jgi:hypothetical protein